MITENNHQAAFEAYEKGYRFAAQGQWAEALPFFSQAFRAHQQQIRYSLFLGGALWHIGQQEAAISLWSLAADFDPAIRVAQYQAQADPLTRDCSRLADFHIRKTMTGVQTKAIETCSDAGRLSSAVWPQTHFGPVDYPEGGPRPYMFYAPDLPDTPVFQRDTADWVGGLEGAYDDIKQEFLRLTSEAHTGQPYIQAHNNMGPEWHELAGQKDWSSLHIFKDGMPTELTQKCPVTCAALAALPLVEHKGNPMEAFFSVLKPKTHIPPHFGLANCRVTVHLPLIIPESCAIRVASTEHKWKAGETFIFDDSFDHEAWNKSGDTRVVLIFEAWRPDMSEGEIKAAKASYKARETWLQARSLPETSQYL